MPSSESSPRLPLAAAGIVLLLGGARLGAPSFLPDEAARLLAHPAIERAVLGVAAASPFDPEVICRAPGLFAAALAAALVTAAAARAGAGTAGLLLAALSPTLILTARSFGPAPVALLLGAVAARALVASTARARTLGISLLVVATLLSIRGPVAATDAVAGAVAGVWGLLATPCIPPWRMDIALPVLVSVLPLAWLGAGSNTAARLRSLGLLAIAAALLGLLAGRLGAAAAAPACLAPTWLMLVARGSRRLPLWIPRWPLVAVAIGGGLLGVANLHVSRDMLDPARRVAWDEAARMLAVLARERALVVASPDLPASLALYAGAPLPVGAPGTQPDGSHDRVLVVSHGATGGLARPAASVESELQDQGFRLRGALEMGELEPGYAAALRRLTGATPAETYLRVRRFERIR